MIQPHVLWTILLSRQSFIEPDPVNPIIRPPPEHQPHHLRKFPAILPAKPAHRLPKSPPLHCLPIPHIAAVHPPQQSALQQHHAHREHILLVGIAIEEMTEFLLLDYPAVLGGEVDALGAAAVVDRFEVGTQGDRDGVHYLEREGRLEKEGFSCEGLMRDFVLLEGRHTLGDLGHQTSQFVRRVRVSSQGARLDIVGQRGGGVVPQRIYLLVPRAEMILLELLSPYMNRPLRIRWVILPLRNCLRCSILAAISWTSIYEEKVISRRRQESWDWLWVRQVRLLAVSLELIVQILESSDSRRELGVDWPILYQSYRNDCKRAGTRRIIWWERKQRGWVGGVRRRESPYQLQERLPLQQTSHLTDCPPTCW